MALSEILQFLRQLAEIESEPGSPEQRKERLRDHQEALAQLLASYRADQPTPDGGLSGLVGIGDGTAPDVDSVDTPIDVAPYDDVEHVSSERIGAVASLYYIYQMEKLGVFRACRRLRELFLAGKIKISGGDGALGLYRFDRREVLRYTQRERHIAYRRVFGYGGSELPAGIPSNGDFHRLFSFFIWQVVTYWRDKRVSQVIRTGGAEPTFGSIAMVRRAGLDLRNNLKFMSYGHVHVLTVEMLQVLEEAFAVLGAPDVRNVFGADTAYDVIEDLLTQHLRETPATSARQRMGISGREILQWLAVTDLANTINQDRFDFLLEWIAVHSEDWVTSAQSVGVLRQAPPTALPWDQRPALPPPARVHPGPRRVNTL